MVEVVERVNRFMFVVKYYEPSRVEIVHFYSGVVDRVPKGNYVFLEWAAHRCV
jgi:hypothetical protein